MISHSFALTPEEESWYDQALTEHADRSGLRMGDTIDTCCPNIPSGRRIFTVTNIATHADAKIIYTFDLIENT